MSLIKDWLLYYAVKQSFKLEGLEIVRLLLEAGADPNASGKGSPLHYLSHHRGLVETARLLLAANAEVNVADKNGITPLHIAARLTQPTKIIKLLEGGADPNAVGKEGRRPVDEISIYSYSRQEMIKLLSI